MLALISRVPAKGRKCTVNLAAERPLGLSCVWAELRIGVRAGERRIRRCLEKSAEELVRLRAVTAVFQEGFGYRDVFLDRGFREAGCGALLTAKAGEIAALAAKRHDRAYLAARRADRQSLHAARTLCESFRYLVLDVPDESFARFEEVCLSLGVTPEPPVRDMPPPDAAVFLCKPRTPVFLPGRCVKLAVEGGGLVKGGREIGRISFVLPEPRRFELPFPQSPILSAAVEAGTVTPDEVTAAAASIV